MYDEVRSYFVAVVVEFASQSSTQKPRGRTSSSQSRRGVGFVKAAPVESKNLAC